jgi:hypothetical protein
VNARVIEMVSSLSQSVGVLVFLSGEDLTEGGRQPTEEERVEEHSRALTSWKEGEHLVHHLGRSPIPKRRVVQERVQHLVRARHVGLQEPSLQILVGSVRWVDRSSSLIYHIPDGHSSIRGEPCQDVVKLGGRPGDVLDAELRLRLLEPPHGIVNPEQGELHSDLVDRVIRVSVSHDHNH